MKCPNTLEVQPRMFVGRQISQDRLNWHNNKKFPLLAKTIPSGQQEVQGVFSKSSDFNNLIDELSKNGSKGVRIYFAAYPDEGQPRVPINCGNKLTLIYAPTDALKKDLGNYYLMHPGQALALVTKKDIQTWVTVEYPKKLVVLNPVADIYDGDGMGDTKCVYHSIDDFNELKKEILLQGVPAIKACFSSYQPSENPHPHYAGRMFVDFTLLDENMDNFYIDDCPNFNQRPKNPRPPFRLIYDEKSGVNYKMNLDNGTLCPPDNFCNSGGL